jgi:hypothetical protein
MKAAFALSAYNRYQSPKVPSSSVADQIPLVSRSGISLRGSDDGVSCLFIEKAKYSDSSCEDDSGSFEAYRVGACLPNVADDVVIGSFKFSFDPSSNTPFFQGYSDPSCTAPSGSPTNFAPAFSCLPDGSEYSEWSCLSQTDVNDAAGIYEV